MGLISPFVLLQFSGSDSLCCFPVLMLKDGVYGKVIGSLNPDYRLSWHWSLLRLSSPMSDEGGKGWVGLSLLCRLEDTYQIYDPRFFFFSAYRCRMSRACVSLVHAFCSVSVQSLVVKFMFAPV